MPDRETITIILMVVGSVGLVIYCLWYDLRRGMRP